MIYLPRSTNSFVCPGIEESAQSPRREPQVLRSTSRKESATEYVLIIVMISCLSASRQISASRSKIMQINFNDSYNIATAFSDTSHPTRLEFLIPPSPKPPRIHQYRSINQSPSRDRHPACSGRDQCGVCHQERHRQPARLFRHQ